MSTMFKVVLVLSILFNLVALWGFFTYIRYGGSPLGELKRKLTGTTKQSGPKIPFEEEYARIQQEIADGKVDSLRVVFFGASITARWDIQKAFPDIHPINRGVGGQLIYNMMPRFQHDVLDLQPKAVVIKFCSINIRPHVPLQHLKDGMAMLCQLSQANGITPIVATIIPAGKPEARIGDFSVVDTLKAFNEWARQYAAQHNFPLLDFAKAIEDDQGFLPRECSVDPVHLNEAGYSIIEAAARPVLNQVTGVPSKSTQASKTLQ